MMRWGLAAATILWVSACGLDVVDFSPNDPENLELIVLAPVSQDAVARFATDAPVRRDPKQLALTYPSDGVVLPANVSALTFRWTGMKPGMMPAATDATVYELSLIGEARELRIYTAEQSALVPEDRWSALLGDPQVRSLSLRLRALSAGPKSSLIEAETRVLKVDGALPSGSLIFETELGLQRARIGDPAATALELPASLTMPCSAGHAVSADGTVLGLACADAQGAVFTLSDLSVLQTLPADPTVASFGAFDPSGQRYVRARADRLELVAVSSGTVLAQLAPGASAAGASMTQPSWSPDGGSIAFLYAPGSQAADPMNAPSEPTLARVVASFAADGSEQWGEPDSLIRGAPKVGRAAPAYAPNGAFLAFACSGMDAKMPASSLCLMPAGGGSASSLASALDKSMMASASSPTWLPSTRENQAWLVFSLPRDDAWSTPSADAAAPARPVTNQLWISAVELDALPAPSAVSPAFWLPFQRATTNNRRALFARAP